MYHADSEVEDLLNDESFKRWVYQPTPELDAFWHHFGEKQPDLRPKMEHARSILEAIDQEMIRHYPAEEQVDRLFAQVQQRIETVPLGPGSFAWRWWVAASVLLCLGLGLWFYGQSRTRTRYDQLVGQAATTLRETVNRSNKPLRVQLPDESTVWLQPHSRISFAQAFEKEGKREVYLSGDAFFEVTKHPDKPFFVYADELVTKVLGTSFWVKAPDISRQVVVQVRTGKVSVFARTDSRANEMQANRELEGVVLTPNQQLAFSRNDVRMKKSLVAEPLPVHAQSFDFKDESVSRIFAALEEAYGIDIIYDEDLLGHCLLTASLSEEPLFEKLNLICKGIEGSYQVVDAQIVISAKGCH